MSDPWVLKSQQWVNTKYKGVSGFVPAPVNGLTGWGTMFALTRALQHELGITALSDSFGPTTLSTLSSKYPTVSSNTSNTNIKAIVQCALWCKGYLGSNYNESFGTWDSVTSANIVSVRTDLGLSPQANVFPKLFKSLLTMDAYVQVSNGTPLVRAIQRSFNSRYINRADFNVIPCDGVYSRDVQRGLMYALQYEIGMKDGVANGSLGPATKDGLSTAEANIAQGSNDSSKYFVHLFQAALVFNGFYSGVYDGKFSSTMGSQVKAFQKFTLLTQSGRADFRTWASLLVSTGDTERSAKACDCITTITAERATTLKKLGYTTIGRYLTNTPNVSDPTDKNIKPGELAVIAAAGMRVFPIFQEGGTGIDFFKYANGKTAARRAHVAAKGYGFPAGTVIYFAVDLDALEEEVFSNVVPHFEGIRDTLVEMGSKYALGIYGARNTCRIVSESGLAKFSFVSGMSTGYSGNLGYPLPKNWSFDQIKEYSVGSGVGAINIDKNVMSGADPAQVPPKSPLSVNEDVFAYVDQLQKAAVDWLATSPGEPAGMTASRLVINYLRAGDVNYVGNPLWTVVGGTVSTRFNTYVESVKKISRVSSIVEPSALNDTGDTRLYGLAHFAAAASAVVQNGVPSITSGIVNLGDLGGWAGDFIQTQGNFTAFGKGYTPVNFAKEFVGALDERYPDNRYPWSDYLQDIDGLLLGNKIRISSTTSFASIFRAHFGNTTTAGWKTRYSAFKALRFGSNLEKAIKVAGAPLVQTSDLTFNGARSGVLALQGTVYGAVSDADKAALADGFMQVLTNKVSSQ